jgi:hypothetical protein
MSEATATFTPAQPGATFNGLQGGTLYQPAQPLAVFALEESTQIFSVALFDENGSATLGSSITWSLTDDAGTVINSRLNVPVGSGSASAFVVILSGLDTKREVARADGFPDNLVRVLTVRATYNSPVAGSAQPLVSDYRFGINPIPLE